MPTWRERLHRPDPPWVGFFWWLFAVLSALFAAVTFGMGDTTAGWLYASLAVAWTARALWGWRTRRAAERTGPARAE